MTGKLILSETANVLREVAPQIPTTIGLGWLAPQTEEQQLENINLYLQDGQVRTDEDISAFDPRFERAEQQFLQEQVAKTTDQTRRKPAIIQPKRQELPQIGEIIKPKQKDPVAEELQQQIDQRDEEKSVMDIDDRQPDQVIDDDYDSSEDTSQIVISQPVLRLQPNPPLDYRPAVQEEDPLLADLRVEQQLRDQPLPLRPDPLPDNDPNRQNTGRYTWLKDLIMNVSDKAVLVPLIDAVSKIKAQDRDTPLTMDEKKQLKQFLSNPKPVREGCRRFLYFDEKNVLREKIICTGSKRIKIRNAVRQ